MEELSKTQIVLLTLLVSFVTSIATGIVTVALVDQSSAGVGQTIQTVIQRTIETVAPGTTDSKPITIKTPPTQSENDLIVQAVSKNSAALVRIKRFNVKPDQAFVGLGVIINKNGLLLTDHSLLNDNITYIGVLPDGKEATLTPSTVNGSTTYGALFTFTPPPGSTIGVATLGNSGNLSLGQKVISLSGAEKDVVQLGVISSFDKGDTTNEKAFINTDFDASTKAFGSLLIDLSGEVVGIKTAASAGTNASYQSINLLKSEIK
jgi:S1-C subfamily serine protease